MVLWWYAQALLVGVLAWGAFAFGSVYPWAYWPLAAAAVMVAFLTFLPRPAKPLLPVALIISLALFSGATAVQLIPVPSASLERLSPHTLEVLRSFELTAGARPDAHPISLAPARTATALMLFVSFALLLVGTARLVAARGPRGIATAITSIGVLLAIVAIVQKPLSPGKIYGFWTPEMGRSPFGPFVNKNHFAGWMMMALPVALGLLSAGLARGMRHVKPTRRDRLLWLSSPEASRLILVAGAAALMALSLVLTLSRSAIAATLAALALAGFVTVRRQANLTQRTLVASYVALLVMVVGMWVGIDTIATLFIGADWSDFNGRLGPWADARGVASRYPIAGTGLNTYGVAALFYQQHDLARIYSQAHNDYLQLAAEGGWLLTAPAILCAAALAVTIWTRFRNETSLSGYWIRVGAVTGLGAIAMQETVEFSLQMPGNAALFAVLCGIALHVSPDRSSR